MTFHPPRAAVRDGRDREPSRRSGLRLRFGWLPIIAVGLGLAAVKYGPRFWGDPPACDSSEATKSISKIVTGALAKTGRPGAAFKVVDMRAASSSGEGRACRATIAIAGQPSISVTYRITWQDRFARKYRLSMHAVRD